MPNGARIHGEIDRVPPEVDRTHRKIDRELLGINRGMPTYLLYPNYFLHFIFLHCRNRRHKTANDTDDCV
ncbi:hypothetical protein GCM10011409_16120 [Lentibacillus populi]|uniref:Uncharacterized protein n=1 Tax=Lentibacillus populi TaxID=1827502 RepID=A0A9W5TWW9_9BACI|nr:hypothetical protein GCM10011409_16120 [Lentibacillus populi]